MPASPTSLLEDALDIPGWLEADSTTPLAERSHRDREIGRRLAADTDAGRVRAWWARIEDRGESLPGRRLDHARRWIDLALALLGFLAGIGVALAAFRYDGTWPVNVIRLLALLVVPQVLLVLLGVVLIPGRLPGLRVLQDAISAINPGALAAAAYRQLAGKPESRVFAWAEARTTATRRFAKWQMLYWSQIAAVAFNAGVIATAAMLIAFTDLAFGWSTTLGLSADTAAEVFRAIAAPWAGLFPAAVPEASLVASSQFFRLEGAAELADSRALTGWWSFTVLAVVTYGLLPRLAFLCFAGWRLRVATWHLLMSDARVTALVDRLGAPELETGGTGPGEQPPLPGPAAGRITPAALGGEAAAVIWNQCVGRDAAAEAIGTRLKLAVTSVLEAGGGSLEAERQALRALAGRREPVVVLTPAWEPPLLEFVDFLGTLREAIGETASIIVVPVAEDGGAITAIESQNWRQAVGRTGDARAYVETGET